MVSFEGTTIPERSIFDYLTFFSDLNFKDTTIGEQVLWKNLSFAPFVNKSAKDGFKSFVVALNKNNYTKEAKFYEQNIGIEAVDNQKENDNLDIAIIIQYFSSHKTT